MKDSQLIANHVWEENGLFRVKISKMKIIQTEELELNQDIINNLTTQENANRILLIKFKYESLVHEVETNDNSDIQQGLKIRISTSGSIGDDENQKNIIKTICADKYTETNKDSLDVLIEGIPSEENQYLVFLKEGIEKVEIRFDISLDHGTHQYQRNFIYDTTFNLEQKKLNENDNEKFKNIYKGYRQKKRLKNAIAFAVLLMLGLYYSPIWSIALPSAIHDAKILKVLFFNVGERLFFFNDLYFIVPYICIFAWAIIFIFYRNIFLKILMSMILAVAFVTQLGMIMGFTSYWNFCIFLPQLLLLIVSIVFIFKTSSVRCSA